MRLIHLKTLELVEFTDAVAAPPFVILSHTWAEGEVTLQDVKLLSRHELKLRPGWRKIVDFCQTAIQHAETLIDQVIEYGWVDTCCIDKTSSAELSEAINSMFRWYREAAACFVFLADVEASGTMLGDDFERSRWFTRGWTLQELLAPREIYFFDKRWTYVGDKLSTVYRISQRTGIDLEVVLTGTWSACCTAQRMSWAADRVTSRQEDMAYCLMGLFDVNMPLLYGEGGEKAFIRLQEEIMKESDDQSIFAWDATSKDRSILQIGGLATSPSQFKNTSSIMAVSMGRDSFVVMTPRGMQINVPIVEQERRTVALLSCRFLDDQQSVVGVYVQREPETVPHSPSTMPRYSRVRAGPVPIRLAAIYMAQIPPAICLVKKDKVADPDRQRWRCWIRFTGLGRSFAVHKESVRHDWQISPDGAMTRLLPARPGSQKPISPFYAVIPFVSSGPTSGFFLVLHLRSASAEQNTDQAAYAGLRKMNPEELMEGQLIRLEYDACKVATNSSTSIVYHQGDTKTGSEYSMLSVKASVIQDQSAFQIDLQYKPYSGDESH
jgi:hypothetical protein